jgi:tetratricopeptide (TPR) repeat protein
LKIFEKIITGIVVLAFITRPFVDFYALLFLAIFLLMLAYAVGGYWLFNPTGIDKRKFIPILSGLILASSIFTWFRTIHLRFDSTFIMTLPVLNGLLFLGLGALMIFEKKLGGIAPNIKSIFFRSLFILAITNFLAYMPISFKPYRMVAKALNKGNKELVNNILMFDYTAEFETAYKKGDCDQALLYAEKANRAGLIWLGVDEDAAVNDTVVSGMFDGIKTDSISISADDLRLLKKKLNDRLDKRELAKIGVTYDNLYDAYKCKARSAYDLGNYDVALRYYIKADSAAYDLYEGTERRAWSLQIIARCYQNLKHYSEADSLLVKAMNICLISKDTFSSRRANIISDLASSLAEQKYYSTSNSFYRWANGLYRRDSLNENTKGNLINNYYYLSKNFLTQDSSEQALFYIHKSFDLEKKYDANYCQTDLLYGTYLYKLSLYEGADSIYKDAQICYQSKYKPDHQIIGECNILLTYVSLALARYDDAKKYLGNGLSIIEKKCGSGSTEYAGCLLLSGHLNKILSEYGKAESDYRNALDIYGQGSGGSESVKATALSDLAELEVTLSRPKSAMEHADEAMALATPVIKMNQPGVTTLLDQLGHVYYATGYYKLSDTLYNKAIRINANYGLSHTASTAIALNGLGLNFLAKNDFGAADSLFAKALKLHLAIFHEKNPLTAQVYLNYASLNISQNKLIEADERLNKALNICRQFFKPDHDLFGDIYVAFGDLSKKRNQKEASKEFYQKALDIYSAKFEANHWKVVATKRKL